MKNTMKKMIDKCVGDKDHGLRSLPKEAKIIFGMLLVFSFLLLSGAVYTEDPIELPVAHAAVDDPYDEVYDEVIDMMLLTFEEFEKLAELNNEFYKEICNEFYKESIEEN